MVDESHHRAVACSAVTAPFTQSDKKKLNKERREECHKAARRYLVKAMHPLSTVD